MSDKNESITKRKCVSPMGRASYAHLFEPKAIEEGKDKKHSITMLFDKDEDLGGLKKAVHYAAVEAWGKDKAKWPKKRRMPFRDGDEDKPDNKEYAGKIFVYASSKEDNPPGVFDRRKKPITKESGDFYSGCMCRVALIAFHYKAAGNEGISFALQSVQKMEDGEKLSGKKGADDFDDLEDEELDDDFLGETDSDEEE